MKKNKEHKAFSCDKCEFYTRYKYNYNKHLQSKKHLNIDAIISSEYKCEVCNKPFISYSGALRHQKKCAVNTVTENKQVETALQILKVQPQDNKNIVININNNTVNQQVNNPKIINIQNVLNEKCANTQNLIDYFKTISIKNDDMHKVYHENFAKTMINIIKTHLEKLPREQWPIFSIDEQTFIRDKDEWKIEKMDNVREFINNIYDIIYNKYVENNTFNDYYRERFIYKEVKRIMRNFISDADLCSSITKKILEYVSTTEDEFLKIFVEELAAAAAAAAAPQARLCAPAPAPARV
jgi:hypothetical protein